MSLDGTTPVDARKWVLFLKGHPMYGLPANSPDGSRELRFQLRRTDKTKAAWNDLLGSPASWTRTIPVSVAPVESVNPTDNAPVLGPRLVGQGNAMPTFQMTILGTVWLGLAAFVLALGIAAVVYLARNTAILRDNLLPQLPALDRPYSLGRFQMAFWFVLILASFVFLWALLWDYNTLTAQALTLMGISSATGLAALAANKNNAGSLDDTTKALKDAGFTTARDIETPRAQLKQARDELSGSAYRRPGGRNSKTRSSS